MADTRLVQELITLEALEQGVDPRLAVEVARQESGFNPDAVSPKGARGVMQLMPATARTLGVNPANPADNIRGGVRYLKQQQQRFGTTRMALAAYNAGPAAVEKYGGVPPYRETQGYVQRIMARIGPASAEASAPRRGAQQRRSQEPMPASQTRPSQDALREELRQIEALEAQEEELRRLEAMEQPQTPQQTPQQTPGADPRAGYEVEVIPGGSTPTPQPLSWGQRLGQAAETALKGVPIAGQLYPMVKPVLQAQYGENLQRLPQMGAAEGITTTGAMLGQAAGTLAAPYAGPFGPTLPLIGRSAGSYLGRQLNVTLGLEEPGMLGDVLSVAGPAVQEVPGMVRAFRTGTPHQVPSSAAERVTAAADANVPLTYGEAVDRPTARMAETALEKVPVIGTGGFRARQQQAVKAAAQHQVEMQQEVLQQTPWANLTQVKAAAATGNKQAQRVVEAVEQAGDDWNRIVQASGNLRAFRVKQVADRLYGKVAELAEGLGNVPIPKSLAVIDDTLKELRTAVVPDTETIRYLEQLKGGLQSQTSTTVSPLLDAAGNPITRTVTMPGKTTYGQLRQLRSDLGDTISDYYTGSNAVVGAKGVGSLAKVKTALEQDLDTFALQSSNPELAAAAKRADTHYKRQVIPYEDRQLATALQSDTPDEIYGKFIQRGHRDRAQNFYNALDPKGKAAVQYGMIAEAQQKALDPTTGVFSPAKFEGSLKAIQEARGVFFSGKEAWKLDGLMKVMRAAERAGQYAENPPTGQRVIPWLIGGGVASAFTSPGTVAGAAATAKGLSWLLTSPTGTRFLLNAHRVAEDSVQMDRVLQELTTQAARLVATEGGERLQEGMQIQVEPGRVGR